MICFRSKIKVRLTVLAFSLIVFICLTSKKFETLYDLTRHSVMKEVIMGKSIYPFLRPRLSNPGHKKSDLPITNSINVPRLLEKRENVFSSIFVSKTADEDAVREEEDNKCDINSKSTHIERHVWEQSAGTRGIIRTRPQNVNDQDCLSETGIQKQDLNTFETNFDAVEPFNSTGVNDYFSADVCHFEANLTVETDFNNDVVVNLSDLQKINETIPQSRHYLFQNDSQVFPKSVAKIDKLSVWRNNSNVTYEFPMSPEDAVNIFGNALTEWEKQEIFNYSNIWYLGLSANKSQHQENKTNNFGFDFKRKNRNGYYKSIIHDHMAYRYEILEELGNGGCGSTVKALDHSNGCLVAVKIIRNSEWDEKFFLREVEIMNILESRPTNNEYFVRKLDCFTFRNHQCLVLELLGPSLIQFRGRPIQDSYLMRQFTNDILHAMYHLKESNIVHTDLKPDNIMLIYGKEINQTEGQLLKVADFGLSCIPDAQPRSNYYCLRSVQTLQYRSPESFLDLPITNQVDMFSVGLILTKLAVGINIMYGRNEVDQLACMMEVLGPPPPYMISPGKEIYAKAITYTTENGLKRIPNRTPLAFLLRGVDDAELVDLIARCLRWDPEFRITPEEALQHPYLKGPVSAAYNQVSLLDNSLR
ncbi:dual specificity tyrosine-phosphorylation-regulated kinase 4-like [Styela clava]